MDQTGSLVNTCNKIYPSEHLLYFLKKLPLNNEVPSNIFKIVKGEITEENSTNSNISLAAQLNNQDIETLKKIKQLIECNDISDNSQEVIKKDNIKPNAIEDDSRKSYMEYKDPSLNKTYTNTTGEKNGLYKDKKSSTGDSQTKVSNNNKNCGSYLITSDIDWLYCYLQKERKTNSEGVPYLHELLEGSNIETPENKVIKRNPELEARCVKLRSQQQAREYRKMTKSVDNVRMRYPDDTIAFQMKYLNRQLIAIGQFIISIFAGFLFGFKGIEWSNGDIDFGVRLMLGVMCALIIALAEIYFLAKKLNEELNVTETIQLGGPPKFSDDAHQTSATKLHQD